MLLTIGHSNHSLEKFFSLLKEHRVDVIGDIRPNIRTAGYPLFYKKSLEKASKNYDIAYVHIKWLSGHKRFGKWSFQYWLDLVESEMKKQQTVLMCTPEDPNLSHRRSLVVKELCKRDIAYVDEVFHIREDGSLESERYLRILEKVQTNPLRKESMLTQPHF